MAELHSQNDAKSETEVPKDTYLQKKGNKLLMNYDQYQKIIYIFLEIIDELRLALKERYISPEEKQQIIDQWRLYNNIIKEYQKIANLLDSGAALKTSNKPSQFRTKNWIEINDESRGT